MLQTTHLKLLKMPILMTLVSVAFYLSFAYDLVRTDFTKLFTLYAALFVLYFKLIQMTAYNFRFLLLVALVFRLVFLFAIPNLSQDFYRFIWDGRMLLQGMNPYLYTPKWVMTVGNFPIAQASELYHGMGALNASHYSNYPPVMQFIFAFAAFVFSKSILGSVIIFRLFIIAADFGILYFGKRLLQSFGMPPHLIFWYLLSPFIIIELSGNLHFESIMIFFLLWSLYLLNTGRWQLAGMVFAISISVKLIPLMFLPLCYQWFKKQPLGIAKLFVFYLIVAFATLLLFAPFYNSEFLNHYSQSVALWFGQFEFNASVYYIARAIGYAVTGYNQIEIIGAFIPFTVLLSALAIALARSNKSMPQLITAMLLMATLYYFTATTVHPWYLVPMVAFSVFTNYKFPLVWSFVIVLSYHAYSNQDYNENLWVVALEYLVVYGCFAWEVFFKKEAQKFILK